MSAITDIVDLVHPTVSGLNVITTDTIWVLFDQELDEETVKSNFFVTGPDYDSFSGPDLLLYNEYSNPGDEDDFLNSAGLRGIVQGTITFERINSGDYETYSGYDYTGEGSSFRTKAIFTPTYRLKPETTYYVYLTGDEDSTDDVSTGISSRTIFDPTKGGNLGTGDIRFLGSFTGTATSDTFNVKITTSGDETSAQYIYWKSSAPALTYGPFSASPRKTILADGVYVSFGDGTYVVNDTFAVVVKKKAIFTGNLVWEFKTGSGSIQTVPTTTSTLITGDPESTSSGITTSTEFLVVSTDPEDQETNISTGSIRTITVTLNKAVDSTTVTDENVTVKAEPVNGDSLEISSAGELVKTLSVSGNTITITI